MYLGGHVKVTYETKLVPTVICNCGKKHELEPCQIKWNQMVRL